MNRSPSLANIDGKRCLPNATCDRHWFVLRVLGAMMLSLVFFRGVGLGQDSTAGGNSRQHTLAWTPILESGISVAGIPVPLPPPVLATIETDTREAAEARVMDLAGNFGLSRFTRNNLNAPVRIQIDEVADAAERRLGYSIHSAYVLYAELNKLKDKTLMESIFGAERDAEDDGSVMRELTESELQALGLAGVTEDRNYLWLEMPLLNKVVVRGMVQVEKAEAEDGFLLAWRLVNTNPLPQAAPLSQPRWAKVERTDGGTFSSTWSQLSTNDLGSKVEGEPQAYSGLGGYVSLKATGLEADQMLVESRMVMHEPEDWFSGSRYLRSKLPLSIQSSAKSLRRKLR